MTWANVWPGGLKRAGAADSLFVHADVRFEREVAELISAAVKSFGRLDVAVNNAGTEGRSAPIVGLTATHYAETFGTNVLGTLLSMKHELRVMQNQGSGAIVNITSMFGDKVFPNLALYVASKHAVIGLTRTAALEAAPVGVRVNAVGPGYIETAMFARVTGSPDNQAAATDTVPQGRAGRPEEVADAIMYLAVSRRWRQGKLTGPPHPARRLSRQLQDDRRRHRARARGSQHPAATQSTRDIDDAGLP